MKKRFTLLKKPIKKTAYSLATLSFCLLSFSCSEQSKIDYRNTSSKINDSNSAASKAIASQVLIENNQLIIRGRDLEGVKTITVKNDEGLNETFEIESISNSEIIANGVRNFSLIAGKLFSLVLADAYGSASFNISIDLEDGSVTASKLSDMGAADGDVLIYDQSGQKWDPRPLSGLNLVGTWNANTNVPVLSSGGASTSPLKGDYYVVAVSGTTSIDGESSWSEGDWVIYNGTTWDRIVNSSSITSFNSRQGAVVPEAGDYELADLGDVDLTGLAADKVLKYDGAKWVVGDDQVSTGGGTGTGETDTVVLNADSDGNSSGEIQFKVNNNTKAVIDNSGNFALGSGTANAKLDVFANSGPLAVFDMLDNTANNFVLKQGSDEYLNVDTSDGAETLTFGNATTNPVFKFLGTRMDVDGDILLTSGKDICIDGANCLSDSGDLKADGSVAMSGDLDLGNQKIINASGAQIKGAIEEALSGTVVVTAGTDAVVGTSTLFTTELSVGDIIDIGGETFSVSAITDDTNLTLSANHSTGASGAAIAKAGNILNLKDYNDDDVLSVKPNGEINVLNMITSPNGILNLASSREMDTNKWGVTFKTKDAAGELQTRLNIRRDDIISYIELVANEGVFGGTGSSADLVLDSTKSSTKGNILIAPGGGSVAVGKNTASEKLDVDGNVKATAFIGDGSQLTDITADSSENTADAVIAADTDSAGGGDILFNTAGTTKASISNEGDMTLGATINSGTGVTSFSVGSASEPSVISLGEDSDNNAAVTWNNTDNYVSIGTRSGAIDYTDTLVVKDGKVGVGTIDPTDKLSVIQNQASSTTISVKNSDVLGNARLLVSNDDEQGYIGMYGNSSTDHSSKAQNRLFLNSTSGMSFRSNNGNFIWYNQGISSSGYESLRLNRVGGNGNSRLGIGVGYQASASGDYNAYSPSYNLSFGSYSTPGEKTIGVERQVHPSIFGGYDLGIYAGGASTGQTDINGGDLNLNSGVSTGTGSSAINFKTSTAGVSGTTDNNPSTKMTITGEGHVGIGTTSPSKKLHINSGAFDHSLLLESSDARVALSLKDNASSADSAVAIGAEGDSLFFRSGDADRMLLDASGNVGVGTDSPAQQLHVHRPADNSSYLQFSNTITGQLATDGLLVGLDSDEDAIIRLREDKNLRLWTNDTERMTITNDGNVGVGTTNPSATLDIAGDLEINGQSRKEVISSSIPENASYQRLKVTIGSTRRVAIVEIKMVLRSSAGIGTNVGVGKFKISRRDGGASVETLSLVNGSSDYLLTPEVSGNDVIWGVTAHNNGTGSTYDLFFEIEGVYSNPSAFTFSEVTGTTAAGGTAFKNYQNNGAFVADITSKIGIGTTSPSKALHVLSTDTEQLYLENPSADGHAQVSFINDSKQWQMGVWGSLDDSFVLRETGAGYRFVVAAGGNVGIGTTTPSEALEVNGNIKADAYLYTSDERFKEDIKTIDSALEGVKKLRGVTYVWRRDEFPERNFEDVMQFGLIAQEVERIYPELVNTSSDGHKSVKYANIVSILIEAIKEQDVRIVDTQERLGKRNREIASLKDKNKDLEKRIQKLEGLVEKLLDK